MDRSMDGCIYSIGIAQHLLPYICSMPTCSPSPAQRRGSAAICPLMEAGNLEKVCIYLFLFMFFLSKYILLLLLTINSSTTSTNYYYLSLIFMLISPNPMCSISSALRRSGSVCSGDEMSQVVVPDPPASLYSLPTHSAERIQR